MSLSPGTTYYVRVKAINSNSESDYSDTINVTTLTSNTTPTPLTASTPVLSKTIPGINSCKIILQQASEFEYIQEYRLTVSINSDFSAPLYNNFIYQYPLNTNTYIEDTTKYTLIQVFNLLPNTLYYIRLKSVNTSNTSSNLDFSFTTLPTLVAPVALGVTELTQITAIANWTKIIGATSYVIDVSTTSSFNTGTLIVNNFDVGDADFYTINVLVQNTNYWYRVRSKQASILSVNSNVISFTTLDAVDTIHGLSFNIQPPAIRQKTNVTTSAFTLKWSKVDTALSYKVEISLQANFSVLENSITTNLTEYTFTSLTANTLYYIRIKSINDVNSSTYTLTTVNTLLGNSLLNPPQLLAPSLIRSTTVVLNWVKRSYAINYILQLSTVLDFSTTILTTNLNDIDNITVEGLSPSTLYYARLFGLSSSESSTASASISFTTTALPPDITLNLVSELSNQQAILNWVTSVIYTSYKLTVYKDTFNYLGNGYFKNKDIGNIASYKLDIFLESNTTYKYFLTGITSTGDIRNSLSGSFTTKENVATLQISTDGSYVQWAGNINRLEVSTDSLFRNLIQGYQPKTITEIANSYKLSSILASKTNYYIRAYFQSSVKGLYSNSIATSGIEPRISNIKVTTTSASIQIKLGTSTEYKIQIKQNISGNYTPISSHQFPVYIGNTDFYLVSSLTANTGYSVDLFYNDNTKYIQANATVYFYTNQYVSITEPVINNGYTLPGIVLDSVEFDRFIIRFSVVYSKYLIQISKRSDFLTLENYIETTNQNYEYICESNTRYYVQAVGIDSGQRTAIGSADTITPALPSYPTSLTTAPTITTTSIINENEVILTYSIVSGATGYVVEVSQNNSFTILDNSLDYFQLDTNKLLISRLSGVKTYYARIYAYNANSVSTYSSVVTIDSTP